MPINSPTPPGICFGLFELDVAAGELRKAGILIKLQPQPFRVLLLLAERAGTVVTREEIQQHLWSEATFVDFEHGINFSINQIRGALEDNAEKPRYIETLPRRGYRFIAAVRAASNGQKAAGIAAAINGASASKQVNPELPANLKKDRVAGYGPTEETRTDGESLNGESEPRHGSRWREMTAAGVVVLLLGSGLWIRHRDAKPHEADFERLSFGRGMVLSARFAPDGQSVIYSAAWDGKPSQLFWARAGSFEARPLGVEADILGISASGEMAVLLNQRFHNASRQGTLALMSLTGSVPRRLLDNVQDADWSPDGSKLAVAHYAGGGRCYLEFPPGKVLYETTGEAWLSHPRISPLGDQIAFLEHPLGGDDSGFLAIISLMGKKKRVLSQVFEGLSGVSWDPAGDSIWLSGYDEATSGVLALFKVTVEGQQRQVRRESSNLSVRDVSRDGHLLLTRDTLRGEVFGRIYPQSNEHELGWLDNSYAADLSPDGATILLSVQGEASRMGYAVYLRKTNGSAAVRLGEGLPKQLSPDGKWALTNYPSGIRPTSAPQLLLLPTGAGQPQSLTHDSISHYWATLLPDGKRLLFEGFEPGRARRNWVQNVSGGKPAPITPEGTAGHQVSPGGKLLAAIDSDQRFWLYPVDGGQPRALPGIEPGEDAISWSADGEYLFVASDTIPVEVHRVGVLTGRRQLVYTLAPSDAAGLWNIGPVLVTPDGRSYVYSDYRILSDLYLASGLR